MKHIHVLMAASLGMLVACSSINEMNFDEKVQIEEGELVESVIFEAPVIRALGEDDETRASLSQEGDNAIRFGWEATDVVGIYPNQGTQVCFEMTNGVGSNVASFDGGGWALRKGYTYSCYYPLVSEMFLDRNTIPVSFANQVQTGVSTFDGVRFFLASEGTSSESGALRFSFQMLNTVIRIKAIGLPAGTYTKMSISTDEPLFVQEGTFGLEDMTITGKTYSNTLDVALNDFTLLETSTESNPVLIYLTSAPVDLRGHTVCIRVYSDDDIIYGCEKNPGKAYEAQAWGGLKCEMERILMNNVIYYTSSDGSIVTPNTDFFGSASIVSNEYIDGMGIITFDEEVTTIANYAFQHCTSLTSIVLPIGLTSIGEFAFSECSGLTGSLTLPEGLTSIGDWAFERCSGLTGDLILPDGMTNISTGAFYGCSGFTGSLNLPDGLTSIDMIAFAGCSGLTGGLILPDELMNIGEQAFNGCSGFTGSLTIPNGVSSIGYASFAGCSGLNGNLILPDELTNIGEQAFEGCSGLTGGLTIPDGVTSVGDYAFNACTGFTGNLTLPAGLTSIGEGAFRYCPGFTGNLILPNELMNIGEQAFNGCSGFTGSLTIPDGVSSIGFASFAGCSGLNGNLILPDELTNIGDRAFEGCFGFIGSLTIPEGVTSIGDRAFTDCSGIYSIVIPESVISIGSRVFLNCRSLESVAVNAVTPPVCGCEVFLNQYEDSRYPIFVPSDCINEYKTAEGWSEYADRIRGAQGGEVPDIPGEEE